MQELVTEFVRENGPVLLVCSIIGTAVAWFCHARLRRMRARDRLAREVEDALVQNAQGLILNVHGIVKNLAASDPTRQQVEQALDRADEQLSEDRERVQDLRELAALDGESHQDESSEAPSGQGSTRERAAAGGQPKDCTSRILGWLGCKRPR